MGHAAEDASLAETGLADDLGTVARVINPRGQGPAVLVCEHASAAIPDMFRELGLAAEDRLSHAAWDIGVRELAEGISAALDCPLVISCVSRLVYDCNRPPEATDAMPEQSERIAVPGNRGLSAAERTFRTRAIYEPFRTLLSETLDARPDAALVTLHSFTPVWNGVQRSAELGLVHEADDRLARAALDAAPLYLPWRTGLNVPYGPADGVTHTLKQHALPRGIRNVMIELRNDFLRSEDQIAGAAAALAALLAGVLPAEVRG